MKQLKPVRLLQPTFANVNKASTEHTLPPHDDEQLAIVTYKQMRNAGVHEERSQEIMFHGRKKEGIKMCFYWPASSMARLSAMLLISWSAAPALWSRVKQIPGG